MHNTVPPSPIKIQYIGLIALGFLLALQLVQFFLIFVLYHYISNVEHRLDANLKETKQEIFQKIGGRQ